MVIVSHCGALDGTRTHSRDTWALGRRLRVGADGDDGDGQGGRFAPETSVTAVTVSRYVRFRAPQAEKIPILKRFQRIFFDFEQIQTPRISQHFTTLHNI